jgi:hypothetical protein
MRRLELTRRPASSSSPAPVTIPWHETPDRFAEEVERFLGEGGIGAVSDPNVAGLTGPVPSSYTTSAGRASPPRGHSFNHRMGTESGAEGDGRAVL